MGRCKSVRANLIFKNTIDKKLFPPLKDVTITHQEFSILDSRLDFKGIDKKNNEVFIEVKNVPLTDFYHLLCLIMKSILFTIDKKNIKE